MSEFDDSFIPVWSINGPDIGSLNNLFFGEDIGMVEEIYGKEVMEQCIADKAIVDMIVECWKEKDISKEEENKAESKDKLEEKPEEVEEEVEEEPIVPDGAPSFNDDMLLYSQDQSNEEEVSKPIKKKADVNFDKRQALIKNGKIKMIENLPAIRKKWGEKFPSRASMPNELRGIQVPERGTQLLKGSFTQTEKQITADAYVMFCGPDSGWDRKKCMTPMIALCLGGARCTSQVSSHIDRKRKSELNLAKNKGIPSKHPFVLFQSFKGAEKATKGAEKAGKKRSRACSDGKKEQKPKRMCVDK